MYVMEPDTGAYRAATTAEVSATLVSRLTEIFDRKPLANLEQVMSFLIARYALAATETVGVILMCSQNRLLGVFELARGSMSECAFQPRQVVQAALEDNASRIILFHNHPSGTPQPSNSDHFVTRRVAEACSLFSLKLEDHLIVAGAACFSFAHSEFQHYLTPRMRGYPDL